MMGSSSGWGESRRIEEERFIEMFRKGKLSVFLLCFPTILSKSKVLWYFDMEWGFSKEDAPVEYNFPSLLLLGGVWVPVDLWHLAIVEAREQWNGRPNSKVRSAARRTQWHNSIKDDWPQQDSSHQREKRFLLGDEKFGLSFTWNCWKEVHSNFS